MENERIKDAVRARYSSVAEQSRESCCSGCGCGTSLLSRTKDIGYSGDELGCIPEEAVLGLGCGNPTAVAEMKAGDTVLDLGSGAGLDAFLAAGRVGTGGKVIGVDMTAEMINKANAIARSNGYENVEFRLGEIENLPVDDCSVDIVVSNCVINLAPDKDKVFREAYRVLRAGGKLSVSDMVTDRKASKEMRDNLDAWAGCVSGALEQGDYLNKIREAGFVDLQVSPATREFYVGDGDDEQTVKLSSITVRALKDGQ